MNCQRARDVLPELLDPRTAANAHLEARAHLAACPDCQREFAALSQIANALDTMPTPQPTPQLRKNFYAMLEEEKHSAASVRAVAERAHRAERMAFWRWLLAPLAVGALLVLAFLLGRHSLPPATSTAPATDDATKRELAALHAKVEKMNTLLVHNIIQQQQNPANERLKDVLAAAATEKPSDKTLDNLIQALMVDPSVNVRLRALEALFAHAERDIVRAGVVTALPREQNPLVQLELIDFVAEAHDRNAAPALEKLSADEGANQAVREAAKRALAQL